MSRSTRLAGSVRDCAIDLNFGLASGAFIFAGSQVVEAQGTASGTVVNVGRSEVVASGGSDVGARISGGTETISSGGVGPAIRSLRARRWCRRAALRSQMSGRLLEAVHIRQKPFAFVRARQSQRYAGETVKWSACSPQQQ